MALALEAFCLYCNHLGGPKILYTCTDQGATTFTKLWVPSAQWGIMEGLDDSSKAEVFFPPSQTSFWQLLNGRFSPNLATRRESMSPWNVIANFCLVVICTHKRQNWRVKQVPYSYKLTIFVQSAWSRLCCIRLFKFVIITLYYITLTYSPGHALQRDTVHPML